MRPNSDVEGYHRRLNKRRVIAAKLVSWNWQLISQQQRARSDRKQENTEKQARLTTLWERYGSGENAISDLPDEASECAYSLEKFI